MTARSAAAQRIRVALFLLVTLGVLVTALVLLGHSTNLFSRKATLHTSFANVGGLIAGSEVRLAGLAIGVVRNIHFSRDEKNQRVNVDLSVRASFLERIRKDSIAQVASKGLLGDAIVDISVGSPDQPALADGDPIDSTEPAGMGQMMARAESAIGRIDTLAADVDARVRQALTPEVAADFGRVMHSAAAVAAGVETGPGLAHALIFQPSIASDATQAVHEVELSAAEIQRSGGELQQLLADLRTGHGLLHELVYDQDSPKLVHDLGGAAHDLGDTARIVRQIAVDTQQGKGTIGGLLEDPSVYEDLTTILGNVKRNSLLKALIRYTIVKDGLERSGRVESPGATKEDKTAPDGAGK